MHRSKTVSFRLLITLIAVIVLFTGVMSACKPKPPIQPQSFTLTFEANGNTVATVSTKGDEAVTLPTAPTKEGFVFDGWYFDKDVWQNAFTANTLLTAPITKDTTVYAKYSAHAPHTYGEWKIEREAQCIYDGVKRRRCTVCNIPDSNEQVIPATGIHDYENGNCIQCVDEQTKGLELRLILTDGLTVKGIGNATDKNIFIPSWYGDLNIKQPIVSIGASAFIGNTNITGVNIPSNVKIIEDSAFENCTSLATINVPDKIETIGKNIFSNTAWYNAQADGVIYVGKIAYSYKGTMSANTSITLKSDTVAIAGNAFKGLKNLTAITIPGSVKNIGNSTFEGCSGLVSVTLGNGVTSIGEKAFYGCSKLTSVAIPGSVKTIKYAAFQGCSSLTGITIPSGVTTIEKGAFRDCKKLTNISIPDSVTELGAFIFDGCSSLTGVRLPSSTTYIPGMMFNNCTALADISFVTSKVTGIGVLAFNGTAWYNAQADGVVYLGKIAYGYKGEMPSGETITLKSGTTAIAGAAFEYAENLTSITIPSGVKFIDDSAFDSCTGLTNIVIPNSVTNISTSAFTGCSNLTSITLPNNLKTIEKRVFYECSALTTINIPNSVKSIGDSAFERCTALKNVTFPNSVTSIGSSAFTRCNSLTEITIPSNVTSLGSYAFSNCSKLTTVTISGSVEIIGRNIFATCAELTSVTISKGVYQIDEDAFKNCTKLANISIPDSVTYIHKDAFVGTAWLNAQSDGVVYAGKMAYVYKGTTSSAPATIKIKEGTLVINYSLFENFTTIENIEIPNSVTLVGAYAFKNCKLTDIKFAGTKSQWKGLTKRTGWCDNTGTVTVTCSDGKLNKYDIEI